VAGWQSGRNYQNGKRLAAPCFETAGKKKTCYNFQVVAELAVFLAEQNWGKGTIGMAHCGAQRGLTWTETVLSIRNPEQKPKRQRRLRRRLTSRKGLGKKRGCPGGVDWGTPPLLPKAKMVRGSLESPWITDGCENGKGGGTVTRGDTVKKKRDRHLTGAKLRPLLRHLIRKKGVFTAEQKGAGKKGAVFQLRRQSKKRKKQKEKGREMVFC